jgi:dTDP-glucose 4,6-dehydratase
LQAVDKPAEWTFPLRGAHYEQRVRFIDDHDIRPGHDRRYALVCDKMKRLGWTPRVGLDEGIQRAVDWYVHNQWWVQ